MYNVQQLGCSLKHRYVDVIDFFPNITKPRVTKSFNDCGVCYLNIVHLLFSFGLLLITCPCALIRQVAFILCGTPYLFGRSCV